MEEKSYWLGLSLTPGIGTKRALRLLNHFGDVRNIWGASRSDLLNAGLDETTTASLLQTRSTIKLDEVEARIREVNAYFICQRDDAYPQHLRNLPDAPLVLYVRGTLLKEDDLAIAVIGTRSATAYGKDVTRMLVKDLAGAGVTIISGLAHGIDAMAHRTALDVGGRTFAVMGNGIDSIYPREHKNLANDILGAGALISEFPLKSQPEAHHFPQRNRLISGLSLGVIIVEAPEKSGALITATFALEQGREVYGVPGNIFSAASRGVNQLLQEGAKLVTSAQDILEDLVITRQQLTVREAIAEVVPLSETQILLLRAFTAESCHMDDLIRATGFTTPMAVGALTTLELQGYVEQDRGGLYRITQAAHILIRELNH